MLVGDRNPTDNGPHDPDKTLVGPAEKKVFQMRRPIQTLSWSPIDGTMIMRSETPYRFGCEHIGGDHVPTEIGNKPHGGCDRTIVPIEFGNLIIGRR